MPLLLRYDLTGQVLRSVDEHPGIIGCGQPFPDAGDRFAFYVSQTWTPSERSKEMGRKVTAAGGRAMLAEILDTRQMEGAIGLDLDDVATACASKLELAVCLQIVQSMVSAAAETFIASLGYPDLARAANWAAEATTALVQETQRRGLL